MGEDTVDQLIRTISLIYVDQLVKSALFTTKFKLVGKVEPMSWLCIKGH